MKIFISKKAQIAGQVFIFILAAALAVLIISYGYNAIKTFTSRTEDIAFINLKTDLQNSIRTIASDYGSVKRLDLILPGKYDMLCFLDQDHSSTMSVRENTPLCTSNNNQLEDYSPFACDGWTTEDYEDNVYLIEGSSGRSFVVSNMIFQGNVGYDCISPRGNKISLRLEGLGDKTKVSEWLVR